MGVAALVFLSCPRPEIPVIVIPVVHFLQVSQHRGRGGVGKFRLTGGATGREEQGRRSISRALTAKTAFEVSA